MAQLSVSTLKQGDTFGVFDTDGNIVPGDRASSQGLFYRDMRHVSGLRLRLNGQALATLSSAIQDDAVVLRTHATNAAATAATGREPPKETIHILRARFLWQGVYYECLTLRNFDTQPHALNLTILYDADFADIFEVRGTPRQRRGETTVEVTAENVAFTYTGLDRAQRRTIVAFDPAPAKLAARQADFQLTLPPQQDMQIYIAASFGDETCQPAPPAAYAERLQDAETKLRALAAPAIKVETANPLFNKVLARAKADLYMLATETGHGLFPYAGVPWYSTAFGRDALITAMQWLWVDPTLARGVLTFLAATQAKDVNAATEAEPGKILHETRAGEMAVLGEVPFAHYYGSIDSTPLFVMLAGMYFDHTDDLATIKTLWPHIEAALGWIDRYGDRDQDGFVEYQPSETGGLVNQGWKDSSDSIFHADGGLAKGTIAVCEVQGYVFAAKRHAARLAAALGQAALATRLQSEAAQLQTRFESAFWCDEIGTYALALDGAKQPCKVRSSNAGHLLFVGIASPAHAAQVAEQLMEPAFFTGWGIRTVAVTEARYNPISYHNGTVWPHDNALIGLGFARYGLGPQVKQLFTGLFDAATAMADYRLPELFCGFERGQGQAPIAYPVACSPQAWSCIAPFALLHAALNQGRPFTAEPTKFPEQIPDFLNEIKVNGRLVYSRRI